jgi:plastocyanin
MEETAPKPKNNTTIIAVVIVIALVAIVGIVFAYKASKNKMASSEEKMENAQMEKQEAMSPSAMPSTAPSANEAMTASPSSMSNEMTIDVEGGAFYFKPNTITVKKGQKVKINFTSKDMVHNFVVDELAVKSPTVKGGTNATFEFTPDKTGTFEYYCSIGQHRAKGMVGKITVE